MKYWIVTAFLFLSKIILAAEMDEVHLSLALIEKKIFASKDISQRNNLLMEKSNILIENNQTEEAIRTLNRIDTSHFTLDESSDHYYKLAIAQTISSHFDQALNAIEKINSPNDSMKSEINFLTIFILNEQENFEECKTSLLEDSTKLNCKNISPSKLPIQIESKSPEKARRLSTIFPGAGQVYDGEIGKGILSLALTAGFLTFGIYNFNEGFYVMGTVSGIFPALKFYSGGRRLAENLAEKQNAQHTEELKKLYRSTIYSLRECN